MEEQFRASRVLRFGVFELDLRTGELRKKGFAVKLQEQPFRVLALLLEHPGELVTREEIRRKLWPDDVVVEFDQNLNNAVKKLRHALDDPAETPRFIETLPRRGYRFIAPVEAATAGPTDFVPRSQRWQRAAVSERLARVKLVVLPFEDLTGDSQQEYFSEGMTEEMIGQLGRLHAGQLRVIGRATAMKFRTGENDIGRFARDWNVEYLLKGSARRSGERVRVTAELIRAQDQTQLWTRTYDRRLRDILGLQIEVARAIARELPIGAPSTGAPEGGDVTRPVNPEAYEAYLKGRYFWTKMTPEAEQKALGYFQKSIELDPDYAPAHAGLSAAYALLSVLGAVPARESQPKAGAAARRALELDDTLPMAHVQLGFYQLIYEWDFAGAKRSFERALELDPSSSAALHAHAHSLVVDGRVDEAIAEMRRAIEADPLWLYGSSDLGFFLYLSRRYDDAIAQCNRTLELDPNFPSPHYYLSQIYEVLRRYPEAFREDQKIMALTGALSSFLDPLEEAFSSSGWEGAQRKRLELQLSWQRKEHVPAFYLMRTYLLLGDKQKALDWLEKACDERHQEVVFLKVSPMFDSLRSDPRFQRLLDRIWET